MKNKLNQIFTEKFRETPTLHFFSPGRMNIIGEHIDYNGGLVLPCSLSIGTYAAIKPNNTNVVRVYSHNFEDLGVVEFSLNELDYNANDSYLKYIKGIFWTLKQHGYEATVGFDCVINGNIPNGAGLSSSASLELLFIYMANYLNAFEIRTLELVKFSQECENNYVKVNCGIMDQFAIGFGQENLAIILDCDTLDYDYTPFNLADNVILIGNTNKRRELIDSKYDERRAECDSAFAKLSTQFDIESLCQLTPEQISEITVDLTKDELKRVRHAITENQRVKDAFAALQNNNIADLGRLLCESHESLKNDYEVTGIELDTLVRLAMENGAIGARMTGAGFGGCIIALVKKDEFETIAAKIAPEYEKIIGYAPEFYVGTTGKGTTVLNEN